MIARQTRWGTGWSSQRRNMREEPSSGWRRTHDESAHPEGLVHRVDESRQASREELLGDAEEDVVGAWRVGASVCWRNAS